MLLPMAERYSHRLKTWRTFATMKLTAILSQPIPSQHSALAQKANYRDYPVYDNAPTGGEPLVDIASYGIAGQSYYSRPNGATGEAIADVPATILLRKTVAERLAAINNALKTCPEITKIFGRPIELYVDEGVRSLTVQQQLYQEVFPRLIREQHPDWKADEIKARRDQLISRPSDRRSPAPHATGSAIDLKLRCADPDLSFKPELFITMGHKDAHMGKATGVDYFETIDCNSRVDTIARRNRRILYWVMRGVLLGQDSGFMVNPTEIWHWSYGDQMWAALTQAPAAFYHLPSETIA
jgi:zinc D-Ala-D-Ala dipeptidase